jgi:hypothetical protein
VPNGCLSLGLALVLGAIAGPQPAVAEEGVALRVLSVLATNSGAVVDPRLVALQQHLSGLPYSSYQVLREQTRYVTYGGRVRFNLPGPGELKIRPKTRDDAGLALKVGLSGQQRRPLVDTDLCLQDHRVLLVGGPRHRGGVLIVLVGTVSAPATAVGYEGQMREQEPLR